jgi:hypothetical protein
VWPWTSVVALESRSHGERSVGVDVDEVAVRARRPPCALLAQPSADRLPRGERQRSECALHRGPANDGAIALVATSSTQSASPCESTTRSSNATTRVGIGEADDAARAEHGVADEEVAIAGHEGDHPLGRRGAQHLDAARLEAALGHVVADPDLEQVAEDEHRVGVGVAQMRGPGREHLGGALGEVEVGDEVDRAPVGGRLEGRDRPGRRRRRLTCGRLGHRRDPPSPLLRRRRSRA